MNVTRQLQQLLMPTLAELRKIEQLDVAALLIENGRQVAASQGSVRSDSHELLLEHGQVQIGIVGEQYTSSGGVVILMTGAVARVSDRHHRRSHDRHQPSQTYR